MTNHELFTPDQSLRNDQARYLSSDIFFYGDEKPSLLREMPFEGTIGTTEILFIDSNVDDAVMDKSELRSPEKPDKRATELTFTSPLIEQVGQGKGPQPTHSNLFSHRHQQ